VVEVLLGGPAFPRLISAFDREPADQADAKVCSAEDQLVAALVDKLVIPGPALGSIGWQPATPDLGEAFGEGQFPR